MFQELLDVKYDCDRDAIRFLVIQKGGDLKIIAAIYKPVLSCLPFVFYICIFNLFTKAGPLLFAISSPAAVGASHAACRV
jgi:hypothetical protein